MIRKIAKIICISPQMLYNNDTKVVTEGSVAYEQYKFNYYNRT